MGLHNIFTRHDTTGYIRLNIRLCQACWKCIAVCRNRVLGKVEFFHRHARIDNAGSCGAGHVQRFVYRELFGRNTPKGGEAV